MPLERQVVSLELAKRLKELGVKQESYFTWSSWVSHAPAENSDCHAEHWEVTERGGGNFGYVFSAFTVAELGEMLPMGYRSYSDEEPDGRVWVCEKTDGEGWVKSEFASTEADARAKMLIYLIEQKLVKP